MGSGWCCQTGLNCRPLHYQWSALPLSYGSVPRIRESAKRPQQGAPILATRPGAAQARETACEGFKTVIIGAGHPWTAINCASCAPIWFPICEIARKSAPTSSASARSAPGIGDCTAGQRNTICSGLGEASRAFPLTLFRQMRSNGPTMKNDKDNREGPSGKSEKNPRQNPRSNPRNDRLKLALRENLKRRKSQARGRDDSASVASSADEVTPHEGGE